MLPDFIRQIRDAISGQSSLHWETQGIATSSGVCWTRSSTVSPNVVRECSLSDILESSTDEKYLLSAKAAAGILRRATRRGRTLPPELETALLLVAQSQEPCAPEITKE